MRRTVLSTRSRKFKILNSQAGIESRLSYPPQCPYLCQCDVSICPPLESKTSVFPYPEGKKTEIRSVLLPWWCRRFSQLLEKGTELRSAESPLSPRGPGRGLPQQGPGHIQQLCLQSQSETNSFNGTQTAVAEMHSGNKYSVLFCHSGYLAPANSLCRRRRPLRAASCPAPQPPGGCTCPLNPTKIRTEGSYFMHKIIYHLDPHRALHLCNDAQCTVIKQTQWLSRAKLQLHSAPSFPVQTEIHFPFHYTWY